MKKFIFVYLLLGMISSGAAAQDDMYFTPSKNSKEIAKELPAAAYSGELRDVDEYNRRGQFSSQYYMLGADSVSADDVINFDADTALAVSDSVPEAENNGGGYYGYDSDEDYACSRMMSRFDDFYWYNPWYSGFYDPYWYGSPYWYARYGWYDPWFYGWHHPWGFGWHYPVYWHFSYYRPYRGFTGTRNYRPGGGRFTGNSVRGFRGNDRTDGVTAGNRRFNGNRNNGFDSDRDKNRFNGNRKDYQVRPNVQNRPSINTVRPSSGGNRGGSFRGGGSFGGSRGNFRGRR